MSKQDRQGVRTATDLERKYNFALLSNSGKSGGGLAAQFNQLAQTVAQFMASTAAALKELDGNAATWFSSGVPTLANHPAVNWTTDELKAKHVGDMYRDDNTGYTYLFKRTGEVYEWVKCFAEQTSIGYTVTFYDENKTKIAVYSVKSGSAVNAPVYTAAKWVDGSGNAITFPYTPTSDISIYASA